MYPAKYRVWTADYSSSSFCDVDTVLPLYPSTSKSCPMFFCPSRTSSDTRHRKTRHVTLRILTICFSVVICAVLPPYCKSGDIQKTTNFNRTLNSERTHHLIIRYCNVWFLIITYTHHIYKTNINNTSNDRSVSHWRRVWQLTCEWQTRRRTVNGDHKQRGWRCCHTLKITPKFYFYIIFN